MGPWPVTAANVSVTPASAPPDLRFTFPDTPKCVVATKFAVAVAPVSVIDAGANVTSVFDGVAVNWTPASKPVWLQRPDESVVTAAGAPPEPPDRVNVVSQLTAALGGPTGKLPYFEVLLKGSRVGGLARRFEIIYARPLRN